MFYKKGVPENLAKFTGKHLFLSLYINKVKGVRTANLLKKRLWRRCFPVNLAKFLRTPFLEITYRRLLLKHGEHLFSQTYRWLLLYLSQVNLTAAQMRQCAMWMIIMWIKCTKKFMNFRYFICLILSNTVVLSQMPKLFTR